jgi:hypothetical protein
MQWGDATGRAIPIDLAGTPPPCGGNRSRACTSTEPVLGARESWPGTHHIRAAGCAPPADVHPLACMSIVMAGHACR